MLANHFYYQTNYPSIMIIIVLPSQSSIFNNLVETLRLVWGGKSSVNFIAPLFPKVSNPPINDFPPQLVKNQQKSLIFIPSAFISLKRVSIQFNSWKCLTKDLISWNLSYLLPNRFILVCWHSKKTILWINVIKYLINLLLWLNFFLQNICWQNINYNNKVREQSDHSIILLKKYNKTI